MTTRPYNDCLAMTLALCGIPDSSTIEVARIGVFLNGRARRAYASCRYWPRFLKVEERLVSEGGLLPYSEDGKDSIKEVLRLHADEPYQVCAAPEYPTFVETASGYQISGYRPSEASTPQSMVVTGSLNPNVTGTYDPTTVAAVTGDGENVYNYVSTSNSNHQFYPYLILTDPVTITGWALNDQMLGKYWDGSYSGGTPLTPDQCDLWTPQSGAGVPSVEAIPLYSAWATYKASFTSTYAAGDEVPEEWFDYMAHGAYSDWLRNEGLADRAALAEVEAQSKLDEQLEVIDRQSGTHVFTRFINHANTQAR